jgi:hypothetical protein
MIDEATHPEKGPAPDFLREAFFRRAQRLTRRRPYIIVMIRIEMNGEGERGANAAGRR